MSETQDLRYRLLIYWHGEIEHRINELAEQGWKLVDTPTPDPGPGAHLEDTMWFCTMVKD